MQRLSGLVVLALLVTLASGSPSGALLGDDGWTSFEFDAYNREFVDVRSNAEWTREGPMTARLTSPSHRLAIRDHSVALRRDEGAYRTRVRVSFSGEGDVVARLGVAGAETVLEDHVVAPPQEIEVRALVRFRRLDEGYEIETLELPESVEVAIESRLGEKLLAVCDSAVALLGVRCRGLEAMFSSATVPLPAAGGTYYISEDALSTAERRRLDRFLERTAFD